MSSVPEDVYLEILARLPVRSLLTCKCVCRFWFRIISHRSFVNMHQKITVQKNNPSLIASDYFWGRCHWLGYDSIYSSIKNKFIMETLYYCNVELFGCCNGMAFYLWDVKNKSILETLYCNVELLGSCDGLVYLWDVNKKYFFLRNPATKEQKIIAKSSEKYTKDDIHVYGFGYDCKIDDYKVIHVVKLLDHKTRYLIDVYTLRKNAWRSSHAELDLIHPWDRDIGVLVNGVLHWTCKRDFKLIITLNISEEKFQELEPPKGSLENENVLRTVGALEGLLCVLVVNKVDLGVWVMQDYGVSESWTKRYNIPREKIIKSDLSVKLLWSFKNGEILFLDDGTLVLYDPKHESSTRLEMRGICMYYSGVVNYFESLASLKSKRQRRRTFGLIRHMNA